MGISKKALFTISLVFLLLTGLSIYTGYLLSYERDNQKSTVHASDPAVDAFLAKLPYSEVGSLGAIGTQGHLSRDQKGDILVVTGIRDNFGLTLEERFLTYAKDFITYSNDLFEVNHLTHYAEYYSALAQSIESPNFPFLFVLRDKLQSNGRERFTLYASTKEGYLCSLPFDFFIPGDIDEGEDFYTSDSLFNHVTYYQHTCSESLSIREVLQNA